MRKILIVGGGFAGLNAALRLEEALSGRRRVEVTLVSDRGHFVFTPLWSHVAGGAAPLARIAKDLRGLFDRTRVVVDRVATLDLQQRSAIGEKGSYPYDFLILTTGSTVDWRGHPEWRPRANSCHSSHDALRANEAAQQALRRAERTPDPTARRTAARLVVAGGGPTGVELAARLADLVRQHVDAVGEARVTLIEPSPELLSDFDPDIRALAHAHLEQAGVEVRLGDAVVGRSSRSVELASGDSIASETMFWCGGVTSPRWLRDTGLPLAPDGRVTTHASLQCVGQHGVYVAGDCASVGPDYPRNADVAVSQGRQAADNVVALMSGRRQREWTWQSPGDFVSLGPGNALASYRGMVLQGKPAMALHGVFHSRLLPTNMGKLNALRSWATDVLGARPQPPPDRLLPGK